MLLVKRSWEDVARAPMRQMYRFILLRFAELPPALEYSSVTVRGTCPMLGGVLLLVVLGVTGACRSSYTTTLPNAGNPTYRQTELRNDHHTSNP